MTSGVVSPFPRRVTSHRPGTEANAQPVVHPEGMAMVAQELGRSAKDFFMGHSSRMRKQFFSTVLRDRAPEAGIQMLPQLLKLSNRARCVKMPRQCVASSKGLMMIKALSFGAQTHLDRTILT